MRRPSPNDSSSSSSSSSSITPAMPPSRASTALSALSTSTTSSTSSSTSSSKSHSYDPYLIPDTFTTPPQPSSPSSRKSSSWETYLAESHLHTSALDSDRRRMRASLLSSMKTYYGNTRWERVPALGDDGVVYVADQAKYQDYTDRIVLFGGEKDFLRRKFCDRRGCTVPTREFDVVKVDKEGRPRPGLVKRMTSKVLG